jgi:hypothetical protein
LAYKSEVVTGVAINQSEYFGYYRGNTVGTKDLSKMSNLDIEVAKAS